MSEGSEKVWGLCYFDWLISWYMYGINVLFKYVMWVVYFN